LIVEVEGESSGQPEQKLYKAIGQIVMAASNDILDGWNRKLVLVVHGDGICKQMARASALEKLGISALALDDNNHDRWLFGEPLTPTVFENRRPD
jgi:UDP-2,3-diacylglucosamine pyrophosphatase LpxH